MSTTPDTCHLHFGPSPDGRYGKLIDPNGHAWIICSGCINSLWEDKQPMNQPEPEPNIADEIVNKLWERLSGGIIRP